VGEGPPHRGSPDDMATFGCVFVDGRMAAFKKDMDICLKPLRLTATRTTHAYFPALAACCSTIEYLTGLWRGNLRDIGWQQVADWARRFMDQPEYDREAMRILMLVFRNPVAHRGIASGVWVDDDRGAGGHGRRMTWQVLADAHHPGCEVVPEPGELTKDPPWPCPYTHRVRIHLKRLSLDIQAGAARYKERLREDANLQRRFRDCMRDLYPV